LKQDLEDNHLVQKVPKQDSHQETLTEQLEILQGLLENFQGIHYDQEERHQRNHPRLTDQKGHHEMHLTQAELQEILQIQAELQEILQIQVELQEILQIQAELQEILQIQVELQEILQI